MIGTVAVFAVAVAYFLLFRSYGFQLEDEGNILFLLDRYLRGEQPYLDFHTGYTPGFYAIGATLYRGLGESTAAVRLAMAVNNAACAAGLYALARRAAGRWTAVLAPLVWVTFLPVFAGEFASFNVPYPAWFATAGWVGLALALACWSRSGGVAWLVVAGLASAYAFSIKLNAGAFSIAAATLVVAMTADARSSRDRLVARAAVIFMVAGVLAVFGMAWRAVDGIVHVLPLAVLAGAVVGPLTGRFAAPGGRGATSALTVLYAAFALPTVAWVLPLVAKLGTERFLSDVLLLGSGAADLYYTGHPLPEPYAVAVLTAFIGLAVAGRLVAARRISPLPVLAAGVVLALVAGVVAGRAPMAESFATSVVLQLENAAFWLVPAANLAGIAWLLLAARKQRDGVRFDVGGEVPWPAVIVAPAVAMYWQLYPRTDFSHVMIAAPLSIVLAVTLLARVMRWWEAGRWPSMRVGRLLVRVGVAAASLLVIAVVLPSRMAGALECVVNHKAQIDVARMRVCLETGLTDDIDELGATIAYLSRVTSPGEPVLAFPALAAILFAAELTTPVPHDYWYPGRPDHDEERRMVAALEQAPPRYAVTLNDGWTFFHGAPAYFADLRRFVVERYRLVGRFGRFDVLALDAGSSGLVVGTGAIRQASASDLAQPLLAARRQAARRWMRSLTPAEAERPDLAGDTATAVLQLRAIREGGDLRVAGWILAGYERDDARVRSAALEAMAAVVRRFGAARFRWADDLEPADYAPWVVGWAGDVPRLRSDGDDRVRRFGETLALIISSELPLTMRPDLFDGAPPRVSLRRSPSGRPSEHGIR